MKPRFIILLMAGWIIAALPGCTLSLAKPPASLPTALIFPTLPPTNTPLAQPTASPTPVATTATPVIPTAALPTLTPATATSGPAATPGAPSGPYAVILVAAADVLNIRSAPGAGNPVVGTFAATATNVQRSGPSAKVGDALWVEVEKPGGGKGWVNFKYLTEYVTPAAFCADTQVNTLITNLDTALTNSNGAALAALVSPAHGMDVRLWRYGRVINYDREHARWMFDSTYEHNWGAAPGSGLDTIGAFHVAVLPKLMEVFNASYSLHCNDPMNLAVFTLVPWPNEYANINFYAVHKPATDPAYGGLDWRTWLVGVEYVNGKPYVFSIIHFQWEP